METTHHEFERVDGFFKRIHAWMGTSDASALVATLAFVTALAIAATLAPPFLVTTTLTAFAVFALAFLIALIVNETFNRRFLYTVNALWIITALCGVFYAPLYLVGIAPLIFFIIAIPASGALRSER